MKSTVGGACSRPPLGAWLRDAALILLGILILGMPSRAPAAAQDMPRPPQLERDVQFWIRVYSQIDTNAGFLHDQYNLAVIYQTLHFAPDSSPGARERQVDAAREALAAALRRIAAAGDAP